MKIINAFKWAIIWAVCIWILCIMNTSKLPKIQIDWGIGPDKIVHFFLFGTMSLSLIIGIKKLNLNRNYFWVAGLSSTLYGIIIEYIQGAFFVYRSFDYADMVANGIGAILVTIILFFKSK
jgi:VanZ family protein